jgi:hypothetical protein
MFQIPEPMRAYWEKQETRKATHDDIVRIQQAIGSPLPASYIEFVTSIGFVVFNDVPGMRNAFSYSIAFADKQEIYQGDIAFLKKPDHVIQGYEICTTPEVEDDDERPFFPANFLPVGNDAGQGQLLIELGERLGRVWYWTEKDWAWGLEDNTWLGYVADDFCDFINKLKEYVAPEDGGLPFYR